MDRTFLVSRLPAKVVIREVDPAGRHSFVFSREQAWTHANRIAQAAKSSQDPRRQVAVGIEFEGLHGMTTIVKTAHAVAEGQPVKRARSNRQRILTAS